MNFMFRKNNKKRLKIIFGILSVIVIIGMFITFSSFILLTGSVLKIKSNRSKNNANTINKSTQTDLSEASQPTSEEAGLLESTNSSEENDTLSNSSVDSSDLEDSGSEE